LIVFYTVKTGQFRHNSAYKFGHDEQSVPTEV